jgi:hypothetical protein
MEALLQAFSLERDHAKATALAFKIVELAPGLVQHARALEQAVARNSKRLKFKCEWCGDEFFIFRSQYFSGRHGGKFCSAECRSEYLKDK